METSPIFFKPFVEGLKYCAHHKLTNQKQSVFTAHIQIYMDNK